jgi:Flp pilus assembly protein TadG
MRSLTSLLRRFRRDERGTLIAEAVIVLPMLIWVYLALFVYWDAYRSINTSQKAAYTISDMISREMNSSPLTPAYIKGMRDVMKYLVDSDQTVKLRVTSVTWSQSRNRYEVDWSVSPDNAFPLLTTSNISTVKARIPTLADGDHVIVVETDVAYHALANGFGWVVDLGGFKWANQDYVGQRRDGTQMFSKGTDPGNPQVMQTVKDMSLKQFIVTRPRFAPKLCMQGFTCS